MTTRGSKPTGMIIVALTGSIAMGKSATARMFRRLGYPVFDADEIVHALYARGGRAVKPVAEAFPEALVDGAIDRDRLAGQVVGNPQALKELEAIVHPLVRQKEKAFLKEARASGRRLVVLDIPLLYETGRHGDVDKVVVVSAPAPLQRDRALARPGMTAAKFQAIMARQVADAEKRQRADFVVDTSRGLDDAFEQVRAVVDRLLGAAVQDGQGHA
jgi:dephospho-CoA kinase